MPFKPYPVRGDLPAAPNTSRARIRLIPLDGYFKSCLIVMLALGSLCAAPPRSKPRPKTSGAPGPSQIPPAGAPGELLDLTKGRSLPIGAMQESRTEFQATLLSDGRVLITGGSLKGASSEWFDPISRAFTPGPPMVSPRQGHRAMALADGRLLVLGGTEGLSAPEILEPGAARFKSMDGDLRMGLFSDVLELEDGHLLLVDGASGKSWTWDPRAKSPKSVGSLHYPRILFRMTRIKDGRVLLSGGWPAPEEPRPVRPGWPQRIPRATPTNQALSVECFDPKKRKWAAWKAVPSARAKHGAAAMPDGRLCLFAGYGNDADSVNETLEILDAAKESTFKAGTMPLWGQSSPGWIFMDGKLLYLAERSVVMKQGADPLALAQPGAVLLCRLANAYVTPLLVPLKDGQILVLGPSSWGPSLERWDPRTRQCHYIGALRAGTETVAQLPDGRVLALGVVVDQVDLKTGNLIPLGWKDELGLLLRKVKIGPVPYTATPPFSANRELKDFALVPLDKSRVLVLGGTEGSFRKPTDTVQIWDLKKKCLSPSGSMKSRRSFPNIAMEGQGVLALKDGSVLIWGP